MFTLKQKLSIVLFKKKYTFSEYYRSTTIFKPLNSYLYGFLAQPTPPFVAKLPKYRIQ